MGLGQDEMNIYIWDDQSRSLLSCCKRQVDFIVLHTYQSLINDLVYKGRKFYIKLQTTHHRK